MTPPDAAAASIPDDAIEAIDDDENEVIMMDPKNYYMVYLLKTSAFLHSCVAFLMMISYYKLKVRTWIFLLCLHRSGSNSGSSGHLQTRERNRA
jgi:hypothetical protein